MLTSEQISKRLEELLQQGEKVLSTHQTSSSDFGGEYVDDAPSHEWATSCLSFLGSVMGNKSEYYSRFAENAKQINSHSYAARACAVLRAAKADYNGGYTTSRGKDENARTALHSDKVFVVHGQDEVAKDKLVRFLEKIHLRPIILHEQPNCGRTIIEKFVDYTDVDFAVVLLTPDDVGGPARSPESQKARARQNVILELGYFLGKLGRAKVTALYKGDVEIPSDYSGVLFVRLDEAGGWKLQLAKEIKEVGLPVDLNNAM